MKYPKLSDGMDYGFGANGERVCLGSRMGRSNILPFDSNVALKFILRKLRFVDGCYDQGGAYWGAPEDLYRAVTLDWHPWKSNWDGTKVEEPAHIEVFVRANSHKSAKQAVREILPNAKFYN